MSKFNTTATKPARGQSPIKAEATPTGSTHEGAPGFAHDAKSELFLLAVSNFVGEDTFYEKAADRDARYTNLVRQLAVEDPGWTLRFLRWLRTGANMRSASLVGAAEFVKARLDARVPSVPAYDVEGFDVDRGVERVAIDVVCQRADEPGELLAYWMSRYGRAVPKPVKRGLADAAQRLYTEYALLKYDTASKGYRFGDVVDLVHPTPAAPWQGALFQHALDRRHGRDWAYDELAPTIPMVALNGNLRGAASEGRPFWSDPDPEVLKAAGMTWEDVLSLAGAKADKAKLWTALIPSMGYMALLRNLRNFDEAGVPDEVAATVATRLADPAQVATSRQFPYRFLAAYENAPSLRWGHALDQALQASLSNLPSLPGRSLILVDTSASMASGGFSARSTMSPVKAAAVFGVALAAKGEHVDLVGFANSVFAHLVPKGASVIREVHRFIDRVGEVGHGTNIAGSVRASFRDHDRVFVVSDMQTMDAGTSGAVPRTVPLYGFNLGGYRHTAFDAGSTNRIEFGGLTDATFRMIPLIEAGKNADWPF